MHHLCDNYSTSLSACENMESSVRFKYVGGNFTHIHLGYVWVKLYFRLKKKNEVKDIMKKIINHVNVGKFLGTPDIWRNCAPFFHIYGKFHHKFN